MEYTKEEFLEKMLDEIGMLLLSLNSERITETEFIIEIKYLTYFYQNEIH
jgi:hypothetical protein